MGGKMPSFRHILLEKQQKLDNIDKSISNMQKLMVSGAIKVQVVESKDVKKAAVKPVLNAPVNK